MTKIKDIIQCLETAAPGSYQMEYDNAGLLTGDRSAETTNILITLDCTEEVVDEALEKGCNLIISHHPVIFKGLKRITGRNYIERTIIKAIKHDIAIYASHTNLDEMKDGVNAMISKKLGLEKTEILLPRHDTLSKLTTFIPKENTEEVLEKIHEAGAGMIGNYGHCSFRVNGTGAFLPNDQANPHIGTKGKLEKVDEDRVEVILPTYLEKTILSALFKAHPYEEVAYYLHRLSNSNQEVGAGMIGFLPEPVPAEKFLLQIKEAMSVKMIRHTRLVKDKIHKVALCGGSGSFLLSTAKSKRADIFISGDFKYHEFFDAENEIIIADIGHYESEQYTKELIYGILREKFANIALHLSEVITNPIFYT